jgi:N-acetyl-anhydromuramyl-L-alanine amidase AmpD
MIWIASPHFSPHAGPRPIRFVVIHTAEVPLARGMARAVARGFFSRPVSAHYCIDPVDVVQCVEDHNVAWHVGGKANGESIGIELAGRAAMTPEQWATPDAQAMLRLAAGLVAGLCARHNVAPVRPTLDAIRAGVGGVVGHWDITRTLGGTNHVDPGSSFPWDALLGMVVEAMTPNIEASINPSDAR